MPDLPSDRDVLSRRAAMKQALRMGAYAAPAIVSVSFPTVASAATPPPLTADLSLTISADNPTPFNTGAVTLTVTLTNSGPSTATNIIVDAQFDRFTSLVSATPSQGTYDSASGRWMVGTLTNGARATLAVRLTFFTLFTGPMTFTTMVAHSDPPDPNPANDSASVTITVIQQPTADLAITATVNDQTPQFGETITFTTTLTNNGPDTATNVVVGTFLPFGLTGISATPSQGTYDTNTGKWFVGTLANHAHVTLAIHATVLPFLMPTRYMADILHSDQDDPDPGNDATTVLVTPQGLDLSIRKTVDTPNANRGATVTFTVTLQNRGTIAGTGVTVTDTVPTQLTFVNGTPSQGAYNSATGLWVVGTIVANGTNPTLTIKMTVPNTGSFFVLNKAAITHSDQVNASAMTSDFATVSVR